MDKRAAPSTQTKVRGGAPASPGSRSTRAAPIWRGRWLRALGVAGLLGGGCTLPADDAEAPGVECSDECPAGTRRTTYEQVVSGEAITIVSENCESYCEVTLTCTLPYVPRVTAAGYECLPLEGWVPFPQDSEVDFSFASSWDPEMVRPGANRCANGVQDGPETSVDCGGDCNACSKNPNGQPCQGHASCEEDYACDTGTGYCGGLGWPGPGDIAAELVASAPLDMGGSARFVYAAASPDQLFLDGTAVGTLPGAPTAMAAFGAILEVVAVATATGTVELFVNQAGTLAHHASVAVGAAATAVAVTRLWDGSGADLEFDVVATLPSGGVAIVASTGAGAWGAPVVIGASQTHTQVVIDSLGSGSRLLVLGGPQGLWTTYDTSFGSNVFAEPRQLLTTPVSALRAAGSAYLVGLRDAPEIRQLGFLGDGTLDPALDYTYPCAGAPVRAIEYTRTTNYLFDPIVFAVCGDQLTALQALARGSAVQRDFAFDLSTVRAIAAGDADGNGTVDLVYAGGGATLVSPGAIP